MSKLQIIAGKSKNLALNADLSQSMILLSSKQLLCEMCLLTDINQIYPIASKY